MPTLIEPEKLRRIERRIKLRKKYSEQASKHTAVKIAADEGVSRSLVEKMGAS